MKMQMDLECFMIFNTMDMITICKKTAQAKAVRSMW